MRPLTACTCTCTVLAASGLALAWNQAAPTENSFTVFRDTNLEGTSAQVTPVTSGRPSVLTELDKTVRGKVKSLEWSLPRGVIVIFYEKTNGTGRQLPVWGTGARDSLKNADFEKRAAAWIWAYVDGWEDAPGFIRDGLRSRPLMTQESKERIVENTLELYRGVGARDTKPDRVVKVDAVTNLPEGELQRMPKAMDNKASSMRWNLPPGVVVVLYDLVNGQKRRMPIWGNGEMMDMRFMNDRVSAWAWYNIGAEGAKPDPH